MARTVLVAGTASHVGKSTVAAGLCRLLADRGVDVVPFKGQNMSNNARVVPRVGPTGGGPWGEIGVSQYVQARAARVPARADMNPVLLKPTAEGRSQLVIHGEAVAHASVREYYDDHWDRARRAVRTAHDRLAADHDLVVAEGAGALVEPNLADRDLANRETAAIADADVVLVADIERGGAFAGVVGTLDLAPPDLADRVVGVVITKFRGDESVLEPAIEDLEARTGLAVLGVLPHDDPGLPAEDSVDLPSGRALRGADDGVADAESVTVAVPRLPHISNATDVDPLVREPGVRVAYVPPDGDLETAGAAGGPPDGIVIPGTKNTVDDLRAMRDGGLAEQVVAFDGPIVGLCGGYQQLGQRIIDPGVESTQAADVVEGLGLLPVETRFSRDKTVCRVTCELDGVGPLAGASGPVSGYEIHLGDTSRLGDSERPFQGSGVATDRVFGTYLHGLFENDRARRAFLETLADRAGVESQPTREDRRDPADAAAALLRANADLAPLSLPSAP
jgi:adenosylcobyric acid synthase